MEQESVNQRLNLIVDTFEKGKKAAFARKAGISPQGAQEILAGRKGDPSFKVLVKILESYPSIDANWLVLGQGDMLRSGDKLAEKLEDDVASISQERIETVVKEIITAELGLSEAAQKEREESIIRAQRIAILEAETMDLRLRIEELNQMKAPIEAQESISESDRGLIKAMRISYQDFSNQLYAKYQLLAMYRQQDKSALQNVIASSEQLSKAALEVFNKNKK